MKTRVALASLAVLFFFVVASRAIDRDARMIDTIALESTYYNSGDSFGGSLWGETATAAPNENWAILLGGGLGTIWPDGGDGVDYWEIGLGMKYYLVQDTSIAVAATYRELDMFDDPDVLTGELTLKHRFVPADDPVSPFARAVIGMRTVETIPEPEIDEDFTEMILALGIGCDFMMADNFAFVFESVWYVTEELGDDEESPDWWLGRIGMQYYWE